MKKKSVEHYLRKSISEAISAAFTAKLSTNFDTEGEFLKFLGFKSKTTET
jgi:hypothetical protein